MPRLLPPAELDAIRRLIEAAPEGLGVDHIARKLRKIPRRNLQRRLAALVRDGQIVAQGRGRATKYKRGAHVVETTGRASGRSTAHGVGGAYIAVSPDGEEIRRVLSRPLHERPPVGYRREFLDAYEPNRTQYLPEPVRERLRAAGRVPAVAPEAGTYLRQILNRLLIDLSWNSSRLEGNTYSLLETQRLLELGEAAEGKAAFETQMILNHKAAIEFLSDNAADVGFERRTILNLHALLSDNLLPDPAASGRLRSIAVGIGDSVYHPLSVPQLVEECFMEILAKAAAIGDPFEQAFFAMAQLPYLQPFEDVNKRVSRLAANIPLIRENLCPLSFVDLPVEDYTQALLGVYELNRIELLRDVFVWAYERSASRYAAVRQSLGEPDTFRLKHREALIEVVGAIVRQRVRREQAPAFIRAWAAKKLSQAERAGFLAMVERELLALHEGNFSRFRIPAAEFEAWQKTW